MGAETASGCVRGWSLLHNSIQPSSSTRNQMYIGSTKRGCLSESINTLKPAGWSNFFQASGPSVDDIGARHHHGLGPGAFLNSRYTVVPSGVEIVTSCGYKFHSN